jgi:hypothetical protein
MPFQSQYRQQKQATEFHLSVSEEDLERKIDAITIYQKSYTKKILITMALSNPNNAIILHNYIIAQKNELNIKEAIVEGIIKKLVWLSSYLKHKSFSEMTKGDVLEYLNSIKKPPELDPMHRIPSHMSLLSFYNYVFT